MAWRPVVSLLEVWGKVWMWSEGRGWMELRLVAML